MLRDIIYTIHLAKTISVEVEVVLLCVVDQDTRCGPAVSRRHVGSGRAVGLRQQAIKPRVIQSDDCGPNMHVVYVLWFVVFWGIH